ncbi:hypothetical protein [Prosthecochloris sp.]|uniref:hypothetical protein n=1 Tax=Prosthecochloris sp. TaxID=290513 RepID=UPI0025E92670|nr:hypothetical protein [Prosthecochloris sp.]
MQKLRAFTGFSINLFRVVIASFTGAPHKGDLPLSKQLSVEQVFNVGRSGNAGFGENIRCNRLPAIVRTVGADKAFFF